MNCPVCPTADLVMSERSGVEIDDCRKCRGVWLDRGELDKLLERAASENARPAPPPQASVQPPMPRAMPPHQHPPVHHDKPDDSHDGYPYQKKRKSWLSEIFD
jgi:uncharacterized protein